MAEIVRDGLRLCSDCTIAACNGDFSGMDDETEARVLAGLERLGREGSLHPSGEGEDEFSWRGCDCCLDGLGGNKTEFVILA